MTKEEREDYFETPNDYDLAQYEEEEGYETVTEK